MEVDTLCRTISETAKELELLNYEIQNLRLKLPESALEAVRERTVATLRSQAILIVRLADSLEGKQWRFRVPELDASTPGRPR